MRPTVVLALLLALPARAQIVPITGRVSSPLSGANAGAAKTPDSGLALSPEAGLLAPSLAGTLLAPSIVPREAAAVQAAPLSAAAKTEARTKAAAPALAPVAAAPGAVLTRSDAALGLEPALAAASKDAEDGKKDEGEALPGKTPAQDPGESEDGREMFDGAAKRPNDANEPTQEELDAAFGPSRKPVKTFLKKFGIAAALLSANSIAYAAVPNDGTETGILAKLSFDTQQFRAALHDLSASGIAESAWRAFTSMFMHANPAHIIGNMLMLALYAPWIQSALGGRRTMTIYLAGGLVAAAAYALFGSAGLMLGASAAISALMGASLTIWTKPKDGEAVDLFRLCFQALAAIILFSEVKSLILVGPVTPEHVVTLAHVVGAAVGLLLGGWYALRRRITSSARPSSP